MTGLLHAAKIIQWRADRLRFGMKSHKENTSTVQLTLSLSLSETDTFGPAQCVRLREICPSYRQGVKKSREQL